LYSEYEYIDVFFMEEFLKSITDHAALKWLITVRKHRCARQNGWVLKLSQYDFKIQHRSGSKNVNADVFSRHVSAAGRKSEVQKNGTDEGEGS
jgi:hypothetical protein